MTGERAVPRTVQALIGRINTDCPWLGQISIASAHLGDGGLRPAASKGHAAPWTMIPPLRLFNTVDCGAVELHAPAVTFNYPPIAGLIVYTNAHNLIPLPATAFGELNSLEITQSLAISETAWDSGAITSPADMPTISAAGMGIRATIASVAACNALYRVGRSGDARRAAVASIAAHIVQGINAGPWAPALRYVVYGALVDSGIAALPGLKEWADEELGSATTIELRAIYREAMRFDPTDGDWFADLSRSVIETATRFAPATDALANSAEASSPSGAQGDAGGLTNHADNYHPGPAAQPDPGQPGTTHSGTGEIAETESTDHPSGEQSDPAGQTEKLAQDPLQPGDTDALPQPEGQPEGQPPSGGYRDSRTPSLGATESPAPQSRPEPSDEARTFAEQQDSTNETPDGQPRAAEPDLDAATETADERCQAHAVDDNESIPDGPASTRRDRADEVRKLESVRDLDSDVRAAEVEAARVFKPPPAPPTKQDEARKPPAARGTGKYVLTWRDPTPLEQSTYRRIAARLRKAKMRAPSSTRYMAADPPGRLDMRVALQADAYADMGLEIEARPFIARRIDPTPEPELSVGFMVDISGSMEWATKVAPSVAWMLLKAVRQIGGRTAAVRYGRKVHPLFHPGAVPSQVPRFIASDGYEAYKGALHALDGALHLSTSSGVRIIFIFSDGRYGAHEAIGGQKIADRLYRRGVRFVWVSVGQANLHARAVRLELNEIDAFKELPLQAARAVEESLRPNLRRRARA